MTDHPEPPGGARREPSTSDSETGAAPPEPGAATTAPLPGEAGPTEPPPPPEPPEEPPPAPPPRAPRRFGRVLVAGIAVALLVLGGVGGFVLGRTTADTPDHRPGIGDSRHLPPGFDGRGRPDFPGGRGDGDRNGPGGPDGNRDGGRGTGS